MPDALPFFLVPDESSPDRLTQRRSARLSGLLRIADGSLVIEWSGSVEVIQRRGPEVLRRVEEVPATRRAVPVERLTDVAVRGWWRPRLEIRAADLEALEGIPTAASGRLTLRLARAERRAAQGFLVNLRDEMAEAALRAAEGA